MPLLGPILDPIVRRKARFQQIDVERFRLELATSVESYRQAFQLVQVACMFQGLESVRGLQSTDLRLTEQHLLAEASVIVAHEADFPVGTMSLTQDSQAGLPLDKDYPEALVRLRGTGASIAEVGSMAVVKRCWGSGVAQLLAMGCARLAHEQGASHLVIGIHPRAAPLYRAAWGFLPLGEAQPHAKLEAPVQGMFTSPEHMHQHLRRRFRGPMRTGARVHEHIFEGVPLPLFDLPKPRPGETFAQLKLPREVFRELFVRGFGNQPPLSPPTLKQIRSQRSDETLARLPLEAA